MTTIDLEHFDCLAYKRRGQHEIYEHIKHLSPQEEVNWFREQVQAGPLAEWWQSLSSSPETAVQRRSDTLFG